MSGRTLSEDGFRGRLGVVFDPHRLYKTNAKVYGPGRYRFSDYLRLGAPMSALTLVLLTVLAGAAA